jgi:hypothetical protein
VVYLEIRNQKKFLLGLIIMILGSFVIVLDYPQVQYFYYLENNTSQILEKDRIEIYQKILIKFNWNNTFGVRNFFNFNINF